MLIQYKDIIKKYNLKINNILHVGAHIAEEHDDYFNNGCDLVYWIEANPFLVKNLELTLDDDKNKVFNCLVSDKDDQEVQFFITNNNQSSSILELGSHRFLFPSIYVDKEIKMKTKTINTLFTENNVNFETIDFINLDIQGAELLALKGINKNLHHIKAIYTEINTDQVYKGCALLTEIDEYLEQYNFRRVETKMWQDHPWGDALYIKDKI